jgi:4'-phosphopantetheinyl transferase EntD
MAVKFIENIDNGLLGYWEITETTDQLFQLFKPMRDELENFLQFRNELRKREWLAARLLLRQMTGTATKISYDPAGKPMLVNKSGHISISHSSNCVVIYYHPAHRPGIDIELITRSVERASRKFLSSRELLDCTIEGQLSNKDLMLRWCAKEAVFKMVPQADVDFAGQITCEANPFDSAEGDLHAKFISGNIQLHIPLHFRLIGDMLMVWGHLENN